MYFDGDESIIFNFPNKFISFLMAISKTKATHQKEKDDKKGLTLGFLTQYYFQSFLTSINNDVNSL